MQKAPAATIQILATALCEMTGSPNHEINVIGTRHGEKLYEALLSREEMASCDDLGDYFRVPPDFRDLNYNRFIDSGEEKISTAVDYNSHNTTRLNLEAMKKLLQKLPRLSTSAG